MSGEDKAREVLADIVADSSAWTAKHIRNGSDADGALAIATADALKAMLAFREEGRLAALDEAAGVAREWGGQNADGWSWVTGTRDSIATSIEALKDQK